MYLYLIRRYAPSWIKWSLGAFFLWIASIWFLDGLWTVLGFLVFVGTLVLCVPVMIYQDLRDIKDQIKQLKAVAKGESELGSLTEKPAAFIAGKTGMPEFMIDWAMKSGHKKFLGMKKTTPQI